MKTYDAVCPACGHRNRKLYLEETGGWMECENCGTLHRVPEFRSEKKRISFSGAAVCREVLLSGSVS